MHVTSSSVWGVTTCVVCRPDRLPSAMTSYAAGHLGAKYAEYSAADMGEALAEAPPGAPMLVLNSAGGDLSGALARLAAEHGAADPPAALALGQGQARHAAPFCHCPPKCRYFQSVSGHTHGRPGRKTLRSRWWRRERARDAGCSCPAATWRQQSCHCWTACWTAWPDPSSLASGCGCPARTLQPSLCHFWNAASRLLLRSPRQVPMQIQRHFGCLPNLDKLATHLISRLCTSPLHRNFPRCCCAPFDKFAVQPK